MQKYLPVIAAAGGGLITEKIDRKAKQKARHLYSLLTQVLNSNFKQVDHAIPPQVNTDDNENIDHVIKLSRTWKIHSMEAEEKPFHLFLMTRCGFFWLYLPTFYIAQATPIQQPFLEQGSPYPLMHQKLFSQEENASDADDLLLERFQYNCFLNMLCSDLKVIMKNQKESPPQALKNFILKLSTLNGDIKSLDQLKSALCFHHRQNIKDMKDFLDMALIKKPQKNAFNYCKDGTSTLQNEACYAKLGMLFHVALGDAFVLYIVQDDEFQELPDPIVRGGKWTYGFKIKYTIC